MIKFLLRNKGMTISGVKNLLNLNTNYLDDDKSHSLKADYYKFKIKLNTSLPPLFDHHKDKTVTSDFERATLFNKNFQNVFKKDQNHQSFKQPRKKCSKMKSFFISYKDINTSTKHLKNKIIGTPEKIPPHFIKHAISSLVFPLSLIFNCSLALSEVPKQWKTSYVIPVYKKVTNTTH